MSDRLDALRLFVRVAEAGSFSRAAAELGLAQPTASRRIAELEESLGATLLRRTTRSLSLTEAGASFLERCRAILEAYDEATAEARGLEHELVGLLRIQASITFGRMILAPALGDFLAKHPHVRVELTLENAFVDLAAEGVDIAFRVGALADSALVSRRIGRAPRRIFASPEFVARWGAPATPERLAELPMIVFPRTGPAKLVLETADGRRADVLVGAVLRSNAPEAVLEVVKKGLGAGVAPCMLVRPEVKAGGLVHLLPDWEPPAAPIHALWPAGRPLGAKARALLEHVAAATAAAGYGI